MVHKQPKNLKHLWVRNSSAMTPACGFNAEGQLCSTQRNVQCCVTLDTITSRGHFASKFVSQANDTPHLPASKSTVRDSELRAQCATVILEHSELRAHCVMVSSERSAWQ